MHQDEFLIQVARAFEAASVPFMVAGSHASSTHGQPRSTQDADFVIDPTIEQLDRFLESLGEDYYVDRFSARQALKERTMFNIVSLTEGWKADLIIRKNRPFSLEEFARRRMQIVHTYSLPFASPEDVILTKLEWDSITPSERQVRDAMGVALVQRKSLDRAYLRKWAPTLGVAEKLEEILRSIDELKEP